MKVMRQKNENRDAHIEQQRKYDNYIFCWKDWMEYMCYLAIKGCVICYLFYDTWRLFFLLIPFAYIDFLTMRKKKLEKQRIELTLQFKSMIEAVATGLSAGYSLERTFVEARSDLLLIYSKEAIIIKEVDGIISGLQMNVPVEQLLQTFGKRSGIDDITNFANVVAVAKKSGGNLVRIIQKTVNRISDKLAVEEEINTMIASKKYEEKIMMAMPYGIIFYLRITDGGYFDVLYHNLLGVIIMTVFLMVIQLADMWAKKIMEIHV